MTQKLYPGLSANVELVYRDNSSWSDSAPMNVFGMEVYEVPRCCFGSVPKKGANTSAPSSDESWRTNPSVTAEFRFSVVARSTQTALLEMQVFGPHVRRRTEEFWARVAAHPEWADARVAEEINKAGAKFGPNQREELLNSLPFKELEPFIGRVQLSSAEFVLVRSDVANRRLFWRVKVDKQGGGEGSYYLNFEPFDGRLIALGRE